jgi:hypothetical protein
MKKILVFILVVALCLAGLWGCAGGKKEYSARVEGLTEDGIIVRIPDSDLGYVYVKHVNADLQIGSLDTVYMEFEESDLKAESGTFVDVFGKEQTYSYILENPKSIRLASPGEPTFG